MAEVVLYTECSDSVSLPSNGVVTKKKYISMYNVKKGN